MRAEGLPGFLSREYVVIDFDRVYKEAGSHFYFQFPTTQVVDVCGRYGPFNSALDIGCGEGGNSLYCSDFVKVVFALDRSIIGIKKLRELAFEKGIENIIAAACDIVEINFARNSFDFIILHTVLDNLDAENGRILLSRCKEWLTCKGFLYVGAFTVDDPACTPSTELTASKTLSPEGWYLQHGELNSLVAGGGDILQYEEVLELDSSHGPPHHHGWARVLFRKD